MAQVLATAFLIALVLGVLKMVWDVQMSKLNRFIKELDEDLKENQ
jgi:hypothetical protein